MPILFFNSPSKNLTSLALFIFALLTTTPAAHAQASMGQLHFLENFAIRVYERGDINQATREFQRILQIDPDNRIAKDYLARAANSPAAPALTDDAQQQGITADIASLRRNAETQENEFNLLATLIRDLIAENDNLYTALDKRTREVMDLREKLYGIPYGRQYTATMAGLQPDRIPQNPHQAGAIIASLGKSGNASHETLDRVEKYLQTLASGSNPRAARQESELAQIKSALNSKIQDLENLKKSIPENNATLEKTISSLTESHNKITDLNELILLKDRQLTHLRERITELEKRLAGRGTELNALLALQQNRLAATTAGLSGIDQQLTGIEHNLADSQNGLTALSTEISRRHNPPAPANGITPSALNALDARLENIETASRADNEQLAQQINSLQNVNSALAGISSETAHYRATLAEKDRQIQSIRTELTAAEQHNRSLNARLAEQEDALLTLTEKTSLSETGTPAAGNDCAGVFNEKMAALENKEKACREIIKSRDNQLQKLTSDLLQTQDALNKKILR